MSVRARMYVQQVARNAGDTASVTLQAVSRGKENTEWSKYTPGGSVMMTLSREASGAYQFFNELVGKELFVDFTQAEPPVCTQCNEYIEGGEGSEIRGADGYIPGEYVHVKAELGCYVNAKRRLGVE